MSTNEETVVHQTSTDQSFLVHEEYMHRFKYTEFLYKDDEGNWRVDCVYRVAQKQVRGGFVNEIFLYLLKNEKTRATCHSVAANIVDTNINMPEQMFRDKKLADYKKQAIRQLIE